MEIMSDFELYKIQSTDYLPSFLENEMVQVKLLSDGISRSQLAKIVPRVIHLYKKLDAWNAVATKEIFDVLLVSDLVPFCTQYVCL